MGLKILFIHSTNGLLFENRSVTKLEESILLMWKERELYKELVSNIENKSKIEWTDWNKISQLTYTWYLNEV